MSMNLANLLAEGKLKKSFMVATLVSTVLGTLTASLALHDKFEEKKAQQKQKKLDHSQDQKIQSLEEQVKRIEYDNKHGDDRSRSASKSSRPRPRRRSTGDDGDSDDYNRQASRSRAAIARQYEEGVRRFGDRFAQGDVISENRLQAEVIALQQSTIDVLNDALMSGRSLTKADVRRLIAAQDRARDGSMEALSDQYTRMLPASERAPMFAENQRIPPTRQLTLPPPASPVNGSFPPPRRTRTLPAETTSASSTGLYCRYSASLQADFRKPVSPAFRPNGSQRCPACDLVIPVTGDKLWVVESNAGSFTIDPRLVIKSHNPQGDYACVICYNDRERDSDCICSNVDALIKHMGTTHTQEEFEREVDVWRS